MDRNISAEEATILSCERPEVSDSVIKNNYSN